jgi:hypothetical protein
MRERPSSVRCGRRLGSMEGWREGAIRGAGRGRARAAGRGSRRRLQVEGGGDGERDLFVPLFSIFRHLRSHVPRRILFTISHAQYSNPIDSKKIYEITSRLRSPHRSMHHQQHLLRLLLLLPHPDPTPIRQFRTRTPRRSATPPSRSTLCVPRCYPSTSRFDLYVQDTWIRIGKGCSDSGSSVCFGTGGGEGREVHSCVPRSDRS